MSLLFDMLSRLVITFLPRSKHVLISWLHSPSAVILEPKKISRSLFPWFPHLFSMKIWDQMPLSLIFECWVLSQLFYSPLSISSRSSLVHLHYLPWRWCHLHIWGYWYFSWQSWFQLVLRVRWVQSCGSLNILRHCNTLEMKCKLTFSSPSATAVSKFAGILSAALSQHHLLAFEIAQPESHHLH